MKFASVSKLTDSMVRVALFSSGSLWSPRSHLNPATFGRPGSSTKQVIVNGRFFITCWGSYEIEAGPGLSITQNIFIISRNENFKLNFIHPPFLLSIRALRRIVSFAGFLKDFSFFLLKNLNWRVIRSRVIYLFIQSNKSLWFCWGIY